MAGPSDAADEDPSEARVRDWLGLAEEPGGIALWEYNPSSGEMHWSRAAYALYELPSDWPTTREAFLGLVHSEDRARVDAQTRRAVAALTDRVH